jgi:hypothetical protein
LVRCYCINQPAHGHPNLPTSGSLLAMLGWDTSVQ